jgi:hypothetical protein
MQEAARLVDRTDRERRSFVQDHFYKDPTASDLYDLVVNTAGFSMTNCASLIVEALHCKQKLSQTTVSETHCS